MTNKIQLAILIAFSFTLSFGIFDPIFGAQPTIGLIDLFAALLVISSFIFNFKKLVKQLDYSVIYLFLFLFSLFTSSVLYGHSEYSKSAFNYKLLIMIFLYIALLLQFKRDSNNIHYSLLAFSIGVLFYAVLLHTFYSHGIVTSKGRTWFFGENPNSTSARFTLAAIYFVYISIYNPFKRTLYQYASLMISLPVMYIILQSGSRGSVLSLALSLVLLLYFSQLKIKYKAIFTLLLVIFSPLIINIFLNTGSIAERLSETISEGGLGAREVIWLSVLDIILTNPILGVGEPGYFQEISKTSGRAVDPHNLLLYILAAGGFVSLTLFSLFYKKLILRSYHLLKRHDVLPFVLLFNITLIALKTGGALTYSIMWFVFAIIAAYPLKLSGNHGHRPKHSFRFRDNV